MPRACKRASACRERLSGEFPGESQFLFSSWAPSERLESPWIIPNCHKSAKETLSSGISPRLCRVSVHVSTCSKSSFVKNMNAECCTVYEPDVRAILLCFWCSSQWWRVCLAGGRPQVQSTSLHNNAIKSATFLYRESIIYNTGRSVTCSDVHLCIS